MNRSETYGFDQENLTEKGDLRKVPTEKIEDLLKKNGINTKVKLTLFLGAHASNLDAELLKEDLDKCDIFLPELIAFNEDDIEGIREISFGNKTSDQFFEEKKYPLSMEDFYKEILEYLYNKKKYIAHVDLKRDDELAMDIVNVYFDKSYQNNLDPEKAAEGLAKKWINFIKLQDKREISILNKLPVEILKQFQVHEDLRSKDEVKLLMFMGALHGTLYSDLTKQITDTHRKLAVSPVIFTFANEIGRRDQAGLEVSKSLELRALMEDILLMFNIPEFKSSFDKIRYLRKAISFFSDDEIKELWRKIVLQDLEVIEEEVIKAMKSKSITLPDTEEELNEFLAR